MNNTHKKQEKTLCMGLSLVHFSYSTKLTFHLKTAIWLRWLSRNLWHTPHWNQLSPVSERSTHVPTRNAFSCSPPGQGATSTNLLLSLYLEWSHVTHIPTSTKMGGATNPKSHLSTVHLCDETYYPEIVFSLSSTLANIHAHSSKLYTHK